MATGTIELTLIHPGRLFGADKALATVILNGEAVDELRLGESVSVDAPVGTAEVSLVVVMGSITRLSKAVEVSVQEGVTTPVTGKYSRLWGKYKLSVD